MCALEIGGGEMKIADEIREYKCPKCGGEVTYAVEYEVGCYCPETHIYRCRKCEYMRRLFDVTKLNEE